MQGKRLWNSSKGGKKKSIGKRKRKGTVKRNNVRNSNWNGKGKGKENKKSKQKGERTGNGNK